MAAWSGFEWEGAAGRAGDLVGVFVHRLDVPAVEGRDPGFSHYGQSVKGGVGGSESNAA